MNPTRDFLMNLKSYANVQNSLDAKERTELFKKIVKQAESLIETGRLPVVADDADVYNLEIAGKD